MWWMSKATNWRSMSPSARISPTPKVKQLRLRRHPDRSRVLLRGGVEGPAFSFLSPRLLRVFLSIHCLPLSVSLDENIGEHRAMRAAGIRRNYNAIGNSGVAVNPHLEIFEMPLLLRRSRMRFGKVDLLLLADESGWQCVYKVICQDGIEYGRIIDVLKPMGFQIGDRFGWRRH